MISEIGLGVDIVEVGWVVPWRRGPGFKTYFNKLLFYKNQSFSNWSIMTILLLRARGLNGPQKARIGNQNVQSSHFLDRKFKKKIIFACSGFWWHKNLLVLNLVIKTNNMKTLTSSCLHLSACVCGRVHVGVGVRVWVCAHISVYLSTCVRLSERLHVR